MIRNLPLKILLFYMLTALSSSNLFAQSGVYGGGPFYKDRSFSINELKNSGFTYVVVWTIHINANGDFNFNAEFPLVQNGAYIGNNTYPNFANDIASLKSAPSTINRVEFCLSAWGSGTFTNIRNLIASQGTGSSSTLYRNFQALKNTFPSVDAIAFDDESTYDVNSATALAVMLGNLGFKVSLVPYTRSDFWTTVATNTNNQRAGTVDRVDLQCYDGGSSNNPCSWNFGSIPIHPGLWSRDKTASQVQSQLNSWKGQCSSKVKGGFMWLYDEFKNSSRTAQYAAAITSVFGGGSRSVPAATYYKDCNYGGLAISLPAGSYTLSRLRSYGISNDDISSVSLNSGYVTRLYWDDNYAGSSLLVTANNPCLVDEGWNDKVSSLILQAGSTALPATRSDTEIITPAGKNNTTETTLLVYPNPVISELYISNAHTMKGGIIGVYDLSGKQVLYATGGVQKINVSTLGPGTYLLVFMKGDKKITQKFIKQ